MEVDPAHRMLTKRLGGFDTVETDFGFHLTLSCSPPPCLAAAGQF